MGTRGQPSGLPPAAFVAFIQTRSGGNRAFGDRLTAITSANALRAIAATYLLLPRSRCCSWAKNGSNTALPVLRFRPDLATPSATAAGKNSRGFRNFRSGNARAHSRPALRRHPCRGQARVGGPVPQSMRGGSSVSPDPCCPTSGGRTAPLAYPLRRPLRCSAMGWRWYAGTDRTSSCCSRTAPSTPCRFPRPIQARSVAGRRLRGRRRVWSVRGVLVHRNRDRDSRGGVIGSVETQWLTSTQARRPQEDALQFRGQPIACSSTRALVSIKPPRSHRSGEPWASVTSMPRLISRRGRATHGYDIVDHNALNPELGDAASFANEHGAGGKWTAAD